MLAAARLPNARALHEEPEHLRMTLVATCFRHTFDIENEVKRKDVLAVGFKIFVAPGCTRGKGWTLAYALPC